MTSRSVRLPRELDQVTAGLISAVLGPGVEVETIAFSDVTQGTTTRARLHLTYGRDGAGLPPTMWFKSSFNSFTERLMAWEALEAEARFYGLAPTIDVHVPEAYGTAFDPEGQSIVLLEDLEAAGATFRSATTPVSYEDAVATLRELARLHAALWRSPRLDDDLSWLPTTLSGGFSGFYLGELVEILPRLLHGSRNDLVAGPLLDSDAVCDAWVNLNHRTASQPHTHLHYDPHIGNTYLDRFGRPGFVDWQCTRRGLWAHDVAYFVTSALGIRDRRRWEHDLLRGYLADLEGFGVQAPGLAAAWIEYRVHLLFGLVVWLMTEPVSQPEEVCRAQIARFAAAVLDHRSLELLEVA
jgi:hypothetical protein